MTIRPGDFAKAVEHVRRQITYFDRLGEHDPIFKWRAKSARISLEALLLVQQHQMEGVVLGRVNERVAE